MVNSADPVATLFPNRLAAVIRWWSAEEAYQAFLTAARSGMGSVEVTSGTPQAFELISRLRAEAGDSCAVGAGTITDSSLAERAVASGAQYLVTPYLAPEVVPVARESGLLPVMGATTPSEIAQAVAAGAGLVKVFPAAPIGGPAYIQAVRGPRPDARSASVGQRWCRDPGRCGLPQGGHTGGRPDQRPVPAGAALNA